MSYLGGKESLHQKIINLIPVHARYVEPFAGGAAIARHLRRADEAVLIERDPQQARKLARELPGHRVLNGDGIEYLERHVASWGPETFLFVDPPYPLDDRRSERTRYCCEMTEANHHQLAQVLLPSRSRIMVCGYPWGLYPSLFKRWKRYEFRAMLRSGAPSVECIWVNYPPPTTLHDYRYLGENKQQRQDQRRQVERNLKKFAAMEPHQRAAVLRALLDAFGAGEVGAHASGIR